MPTQNHALMHAVIELSPGLLAVGVDRLWQGADVVVEKAGLVGGRASAIRHMPAVVKMLSEWS